MKEAVQKHLGGDSGKESSSQGDQKVGRLEPTKSAEMGKDEQESESDLEEEDDYQEKTSMED